MTRWERFKRDGPRRTTGEGEPPPGYLDWRSSIPFTDEEIALQLEADAKAVSHNDFYADKLRKRASRVREGYLSRGDLARVLDALITTCGICGKKALYRTGTEGRCYTHRRLLSSPARNRVKRLEDRSAVHEEERLARDYRDTKGVKRGRSRRHTTQGR
jgi:hypothetical protein